MIKISPFMYYEFVTHYYTVPDGVQVKKYFSNIYSDSVVVERIQEIVAGGPDVGMFPSFG